ncbi:B3 domain-containing protein Os03g0619600 [Triticum aestivum]|uniref:B3 domain-containing protein Os03g0619600 n=1 Tax=Triticum aestivum TaxID=4565 RepID=UPI001D015B6B|nr:B3 domain-containing protein Os03g0619600-like [Triticum aestivum]
MDFEFFTIMLSNSLKKLRLPQKFAKMLYGREPRKMKLREAGRRRLLWDVGVVLDAEGHIYLGHGWKQFAQAHDLRLGHFLVLSHDGHDVLTVKVFDGSMCRRDYQHDDDASNGTSGDSGNTLFLIMYMVRPLAQQGAEREGEAPSQTGPEEHRVEQGVKLVMQTPRWLYSKMSNPCDSDGSQKERSYSSEELPAEDSLSADNSVESANQRALSNNYVVSMQCYLSKAQKVKIDALIEKIEPRFTVLVVQMKKSNIERHTLIIQKDYAIEHFPCEDTTVMLQLPGKNKDWKCTFRIRPSGASDAGRRSLYLHNFTCDNHVREGDICLFQPMTNVEQRKFVVRVHFLNKASSIDRSPLERTDAGSNRGRPSVKMVLTANVKEEPASDGEDHGYSYNSEEAWEPLFVPPDRPRLTDVQEKKVWKKIHAIKSELPIYVTVMNKTSVRLCKSPYLTLGKKYVSRYLEKQYFTGHHGKKNMMTLVLQREGKNRRWHTELRLGSHRATIAKGWTSFSRDNHLQVDDLCLFKLMRNEETLKMMVHIIRRKKCLA